jgi:hypothetical protein
MMKEHIKDEWTYLFWIHYLLDKLSTDVHYKNIKNEENISAAGRIRLLKDSYLDQCAFDYVTMENFNK